MILTDPFFYALAIPAFLLVGISKGGFGGGLGSLGVPMMALAIPVPQDHENGRVVTVDGAVRDFNVMVRRGRWAAHVRRVDAPTTLHMQAEVTIVLARTSASLDVNCLGPEDAVLIEGEHEVDLVHGAWVVAELTRV